MSRPSTPLAETIPVHSLSIDRRAVPFAVSEQLAMPADVLPVALRAARIEGDVRRLVVLSTCHRVEIYAELPEGAEGPRIRLATRLAAMLGVDPAMVDGCATYRVGAPASRHLYRVAAGLDAELLGESEILTQVAAALRCAVAAHTASPALKALFKGAVASGERARREIWGRYPRADIGSIAVEAASAGFETLVAPQTLVIGAGHVGRLAARALYRRGVTGFTIVNRTGDRARELAERYDAAWSTLDTLDSTLAAADAVVVTTGATSFVLDAARIARLMESRSRPLTIIDTATPRNVDPAIRALVNVRLADPDDLQPLIERARTERASAVPSVESLIDDELTSLLGRHWRAAPHIPSPQGIGALCYAGS